MRRVLVALLGAWVAAVAAGCNRYDPTLYQGRVTDRQGVGVADAEVRVCYVGWDFDWRMEGGFPLTMGSSFCSEPVSADRSGRYEVVFAAPDSAILLARKDGWVQVGDFLARDGHVVLERADEARRAEREQEREAEARFRLRRPGESDTDYYCRVVRKRSHKVDVVYQGIRITIVQAALEAEGGLLFAVAGPYGLLERLEQDLVITRSLGGAEGPLAAEFEVLPDTTACDRQMYFIRSVGAVDPSETEGPTSVHVEIPSHRAGFHMELWKLP